MLAFFKHWHAVSKKKKTSHFNGIDGKKIRMSDFFSKV